MDTLQADLNTARQRFAEGLSLPAGLLPAAIARSWERSRMAGLLPWRPRLADGGLDLAGLSESDQDLAEAVRPSLEQLWELIGDAQWMLFCVNPDSRIVQTRQPQESVGPLLALHPGRRVAEADVGTTAPACALADAVPTVVVGNQHYLEEFERFFCVSVPLRGLSGEILGALDLTGIGHRNAGAMLERLQHAALATENRLFQKVAGCRIVALQHDPDLLDSPLQALLALREDGTIEAANRAAQRLLGIEGYRPLGLNLQHLLQHADQHLLGYDTRLLTLADGSRLHGRILGQPMVRSRVPRSMVTSLGSDPGVNAQLCAAGKALSADLPVLVLGPTGSGKEVFARAVHEGHNAAAPFIAINCAALPESLAEAELFGYDEGSFTGARKGGAIGLLEAAHGGTLLLDEIGDMPLSLQTRLLRVLQERRILRVGSIRSRPWEVRVIAATHCNLAEKVASGTFREDLYYRLDGLRVELPALAQRFDKSQLIDTAFARTAGPALSDAAKARLMAYSWPGNLRQLNNVARRAAVLATGEPAITPEHLPDELRQYVPSSGVGRLADSTRLAIEQALTAHTGNVSAAANQLGISRTTLYKHLRR